jgi:hypothetical protein
MFKKLGLVITGLLFLTLSANTQHLEQDLKRADSLFAVQQFTQSFELYQSIYEQAQHASPVMLLKMAYIKEGLGDITLAQYYLNEYYLATSNELALEKMETLAETHALEGYDHDDITFLFNLYYKHYNWLLIGLILLTAVIFTILIYQKKKRTGSPVTTAVFLILLLGSLLYLVNFGKDYNKGIIVKNNTFVMAAPAAGADIVDVIQKGHKVAIKGTHDVWSEIDWDGRQVYVKSKSIRPLTIW